MDIGQFKELLDEIKPKIEEDSFLINNESYIFDYEPQYELLVREYIKNLLNFYDFENSKIKPLNIDLFELVIEMLENKRIGDKSFLEKSIETEKTDGIDRLLQSLRGLLKTEHVVNLIQQKTQSHNLLLLTGVGKVYPLIRTHVITTTLNVKIPIILFYPGSYDSNYGVNLFKGATCLGLGDDSHYRSKKLIVK